MKFHARIFLGNPRRRGEATSSFFREFIAQAIHFARAARSHASASSKLPRTVEPNEAPDELFVASF